MRLLPLTIYVSLVATSHGLVVTPYSNHARGGVPGKLFSRPMDDSPFRPLRPYPSYDVTPTAPFSDHPTTLRCYTIQREGSYNSPALFLLLARRRTLNL